MYPEQGDQGGNVHECSAEDRLCVAAAHKEDQIELSRHLYLVGCRSVQSKPRYYQKLWIGMRKKTAYPWGRSNPQAASGPRKGYAMIKLTTDDREGQAPEMQQSLDELAREGARRMIAAALELEVEQYVQSVRHLRDEEGHAQVVRNGKSHHERTVHLGGGSIKIERRVCMIVGRSTALRAGFCRPTCGALLD